MIESEFPDAEVCRTCSRDELQSLTVSGWRLLTIRDLTRQEAGLPYYVQEIQPGFSYTTTVTKQSPAVLVQEPIFVLGRSKDTELLTVRLELDTVTKVNRSLQDETANYKTSLTKSEKEVADLRMQLKASETKANIFGEDKLKAQENFRDAEIRLRKLRAEVGEARWREIFPPPGEGKAP